MPTINRFFQDAYPATDELQCITLYIPAGDEFKWLLAGLLRLPTLESSYQDPDSEQTQGLADIWREGYDVTDWEGCEVSGLINIDVFTVNGAPLAGAGTLSYNASATLPFGYSMSNTNTNLLGIENNVWLPAGEYDYVGWSSLTTGGGNTDVAIATGAGVIDTIISNLAQGGAFGTRVKSTGTFTIPSDGLYKIVAANNGTGAGGNRQANWISHHIRQTS